MPRPVGGWFNQQYNDKLFSKSSNILDRKRHSLVKIIFVHLFQLVVLQIFHPTTPPCYKQNQKRFSYSLVGCGGSIDLGVQDLWRHLSNEFWGFLKASLLYIKFPPSGPKGQKSSSQRQLPRKRSTRIRWSSDRSQQQSNTTRRSNFTITESLYYDLIFQYKKKYFTTLPFQLNLRFCKLQRTKFYWSLFVCLFVCLFVS